MNNLSDTNITELQQKISCVSHEIRNYLSICDMYSTILERNIKNSEINNSSINNAISCIKKSLQIINSNLLDLKSINPENEKYIDLEMILNRALELARGYIFDKDIKISLICKKTASVYVDENRFISCIVNIIKNAVESIEENGNIDISCDIIDDIAKIRIINNGKPISKEKQSKIFKKGYTSKQSGCGLGLWMCKTYLESQRASLELLKSNSKETVFEISVPIANL